MDIGIGLPSMVPGTDGRTISAWAQAAEAGGFSSVGALDRLAFSNHDPLISLAAAAAVTERIGLLTSVLIAPLRNTALLIKQVMSLDSLAGGRVTLGLAVGSRADDFELAGVPTHTRGRRFGGQLRDVRSSWDGTADGLLALVGPAPSRSGGPPLLIGGMSPAAMQRVAQHGDGWIAGGGGPPMFAAGAAAAAQAWSDAGRPGSPRLAAIGYYALGPDGTDAARRYVGSYYTFLAPDMVSRILAATAVTEQAVRDMVDAYKRAGCDELVLFPCSNDIGQVELLATAAL